MSEKQNQETLKEEEMWQYYKETKDAKVREAFIVQYAPLVKYVAGKIAMGMPQNIEFGDLVGYGTLGLLDGIEKFDPSRKIKFKTYAVTRIRGAIYDELRAIDWAPRSIRKKAKEIEGAIDTLENKLGRSVTDKEVVEELGVSVEDFHKTLVKICSASLISINDAWSLDDDNDKLSIVETIESPRSLHPDIMLEKKEDIFTIAKAIQDLSSRERKVFILYYYENLTLKEVGKILSVTESRVSQLHQKAKRQLLSNIKII